QQATCQDKASTAAEGTRVAFVVIPAKWGSSGFATFDDTGFPRSRGRPHSRRPDEGRGPSSLSCRGGSTWIPAAACPGEGRGRDDKISRKLSLSDDVSPSGFQPLRSP